MGTYTTNYNLFMPSIGEQGWGDLVNGNFTTIDMAMKGLSNNIGTLETEIGAVEGRVTNLEAGNFTNITTTGDVTVNGDLIVTGSLGRLTEESGIISAIKFSNSIVLVENSTKTYTYSSNPIANTVYFKFSYGTGLSNVSGSAYLKINGITFYTYNKSGFANPPVYESTGTVELHDGDVIEASAGGSGVSMSITMISNGYLIKL